MHSLGIILPTRNSMAELPDHLRSLDSWIDLAQEVVAVDSQSTDGTREYLQGHLQHPQVRLLDRPPGLYASWNFGISRIRSRYVYISTIGDTVQREGLQAWLEAIDRLGCDVLVSPPEFVSPHRADKRVPRWPIHELILELNLTSPQALAPVVSTFYVWRHALDGLNSVLGSSASNLYRTDLLQKYPFPEDCGTAGDVIWCLENIERITLGIFPKPCSTFLWHAPAGRNSPVLTKYLLDRAFHSARRQLEEILEPNARSGEAADRLPWRELWESLDQLRSRRTDWEGFRQSSWPWWLSYKAWNARQQSGQLQQNIERLKPLFLSQPALRK
jgi:glycosyltransferase involved in cell wall biosynthesis